MLKFIGKVKKQLGLDFKFKDETETYEAKPVVEVRPQVEFIGEFEGPSGPMSGIIPMNYAEKAMVLKKMEEPVSEWKPPAPEVGIENLRRKTEEYRKEIERLSREIESSPAKRVGVPLTGMGRFLMERIPSVREVEEKRKALENYKIALAQYEDLIRQAEGKPMTQIEGIKRAIQTMRAEEIMPFFSTALTIEEAGKAMEAVDKMKRGEKLNDYEKSLIERVQATAVPAKRPLAYGVTKTVIGMLPYAAEFGIGRAAIAKPVETALKGTIRSMVEVSVPKTMQKLWKLPAKVAIKDLFAKAIGTAAQAGVYAGMRIPAHIAEEALPYYEELQNPYFKKIYEDMGPYNWKEVMARKFGSDFVELLTEYTGSVVQNPLDYLAKATLGKYFAKTGIKLTSKNWQKIARQIEWNGIIGEVFEEELGELLEAPIEKRKYYTLATPEGVERLLTETLGIAAFGGIGQVATSIKTPGLTIEDITQKGKPKKLTEFRGYRDLSTKILEQLKGRKVVSKQYISDLTKQQGLKKAEIDLINEVLEEYKNQDKIPVKEFADKVKAALLPLEPRTVGPESGWRALSYEGITLPPEQRGEVLDYDERIYESPIETTAGGVHFEEEIFPKYFAHVRFEDVPNNTRRIIEIQSDLFQKGRLEREIKTLPGFRGLDLKEQSKARAKYLSEEEAKEYLSILEKSPLFLPPLEGHRGVLALPWERRGKDIERFRELSRKADENIAKERGPQLAPLFPYRNTWYERIIREEIKRAAQDGQKILRFPTGETAMMIEGLGETQRWWNNRTSEVLTPEELEVGLEVSIIEETWIITDVLEDGKFKAIPKDFLEQTIDQELPDDPQEVKEIMEALDLPLLNQDAETFDISGEIDTSNPIYKFYEGPIQQFLKRIRPDLKRITDENGVTWFETKITPEDAKKPVIAYKRKIPEEEAIYNIPTEQAEKILRRFFSEKEVKFLAKDVVYDAKGNKVYGKYAEALIEVVEKNGKVSDRVLYHEAFHAYFNLFTTPKEREELIKEAIRKHKGKDVWKEIEKEYVSGAARYRGKRLVSLSQWKLDRIVAEEMLAEGFAIYNMKGTTLKEKMTLAAVRFYVKMKARILRWIGKKPKILPFYERIMRGERPKEAVTPTGKVRFARKKIPKEEAEEFEPEEEEQRKLEELYREEFNKIKEEAEKKLFQDIRALGGLRIPEGLKEEMSDIPIDILRKTGQTPDEIIDELNGMGYNFESGDELIEKIRSIRTMPSRFRRAKTVLEKRLEEVKVMIKPLKKETRKDIESRIKKLQREAERIIKGATIGRNIPPKQAIKKTIEKPFPERKIVRTETQLLKAKLRAEARGAKWGSRAAQEKIRQLKKEYREKTKSVQQIKQELVNYARKTMPLSVRGKIITQVKNVKTEVDLLRAIGLADKYNEQAMARDLRKKIIKEIKSTKAKVKEGILRGKYTADVQKKLNKIAMGLTGDRAAAREKIAENIRRYHEGELSYDEMVEQNEMLSMVGIKEMNSKELEAVLNNIKSLKETGKTLREIRKFNEETRIQRLKDKFIDIITGGKGIKKGVLSVPRKELEAMQKGLRKYADIVANWQYGWDNLLDKLSKFDRTSKPYQSALSRFGAAVHMARDKQNAGERKYLRMVQNAAMEIFEVKSRRSLSRLLNKMKTEKIDLGTFKNLDGEEVRLRLTKEQIMQKYAELLDPTLEDTFREGMRWTPEMERAIVDNLTEKEKKWVAWHMDFYQKYYDTINEVYREIYGVDLPKNPNYVPIGRDIEAKLPEDVLLAKDAAQYASVVNGSLKTRIKTRTPLKFTELDAVLINHILQMEHFKAWAQTMKDMRRIFGDKEMRTAIRQYHGADILKKIDGFLNDMARDGIDRAKIVRAVDILRRNFTRAVLGLKPAISLKQIPSVLAYTTEMPIRDFIGGVSDFWKNPIRNYRFLVEHSPYFRKRFSEGFERDIKFAMKKGWTEQISSTGKISDWFMLLIRGGDKFAVIQGSWAKYKSALKEGKTTQQAIQEAEATTRRTQPTFDLETLAPLQRGGSWMKLFTMFQNQPNKYFRIIADNARNFRFGRGSRAKALSNIIIAWVVLPALFQLMADAFRWRKEHQLRVLLLGPINDFLVIGQMAQSIYGWITNEPFEYQASPVFSTAQDLQRAITKTRKLVNPAKDIEIDDFIDAAEYYGKAAGQLTGIPTPYIIQLERAAREGGLENIIFTPYALGQTGKEGKKKEEGRIKWNKRETESKTKEKAGRKRWNY